MLWCQAPSQMRVTWYATSNVLDPVETSLAVRMNEHDRLVLMNIRLHILEHVQNETVDQHLLVRPIGLGRLLAACARRPSNHLSRLNAKYLAQIDFTFLTSRNALHFVSLYSSENENETLAQVVWIERVFDLR